MGTGSVDFPKKTYFSRPRGQTWPTSGLHEHKTHLSHNQNPVSKGLTQNHVRKYERGRNHLWLGLSLVTFTYPGVDYDSTGLRNWATVSAILEGYGVQQVARHRPVPMPADQSAGDTFLGRRYLGGFGANNCFFWWGGRRSNKP